MRPSASNMGGSDTKANAVYTTLCTICTIIKEDVRFDLGLMVMFRHGCLCSFGVPVMAHVQRGMC